MSRTVPPLVLAAAVLLAANPRSRADDVPVGTVRTLPVVSVSLSVGDTEKETKRVVYAPPPGWYIRSHRVECPKRQGLTSFSVGTVPAGWRWQQSEASAEAGKVKLAAAGGPAGATAAGGTGGAERDVTASGRRSEQASHHTLVVDVSARGQGLWRGGGGIELTVVAELVYLGTATAGR